MDELENTEIPKTSSEAINEGPELSVQPSPDTADIQNWSIAERSKPIPEGSLETPEDKDISLNWVDRRLDRADSGIIDAASGEINTKALDAPRKSELEPEIALQVEALTNAMDNPLAARVTAYGDSLENHNDNQPLSISEMQDYLDAVSTATDDRTGDVNGAAADIVMNMVVARAHQLDASVPRELVTFLRPSPDEIAAYINDYQNVNRHESLFIASVESRQAELSLALQDPAEMKQSSNESFRTGPARAQAEAEQAKMAATAREKIFGSAEATKDPILDAEPKSVLAALDAEIAYLDAHKARGEAGTDRSEFNKRLAGAKAAKEIAISWAKEYERMAPSGRADNFLDYVADLVQTDSDRNDQAIQDAGEWSTRYYADAVTNIVEAGEIEGETKTPASIESAPISDADRLAATEQAVQAGELLGIRVEGDPEVWLRQKADQIDKFTLTANQLKTLETEQKAAAKRQHIEGNGGPADIRYRQIDAINNTRVLETSNPRDIQRILDHLMPQMRQDYVDRWIPEMMDSMRKHLKVNPSARYYFTFNSETGTDGKRLFTVGSGRIG